MSPDLHHLSGAYAVDALDETERHAFEQHLTSCADCRAEVAELSAAAQSLTALTETAPPPGLRDAVLSGITRVRPLPPLSEPAEDEGARDAQRVGGGRSDAVVPFRRRATTWFAAAAAAAVITVGGLVWSPWSEPVDPSPVAQVTAAEDALRVRSTSGELTAEVAYSRQLGRAAITVGGLPPAPEGRTYQLWYVGTDEVARSAGLLTADRDGRGELLLEGDPSAAAAVGMTLEPAGGSPRPTTDPIVVLPLT